MFNLLVVLCFVAICLLLFVLIAPPKKYCVKFFQTYDGNWKNGEYIEVVCDMDMLTLLILMMQKNKIRTIDNKYIQHIIVDIKQIEGKNNV